jgi:hypothetical protein
MDFHEELIKITEFKPLEDILLRKRAAELLKASKSEQITVAVKPSNLVELTRVGERFAPDSCYHEMNLKYIVANGFLPNKSLPTHLEAKIPSTELSSYESAREANRSIIPNLIVRERPGIFYKPIKECSFYGRLSCESEVSESVASEEQKKVSNITPTPEKVSEPLLDYNFSDDISSELSVSESFELEEKKKTVTVKQPSKEIKVVKRPKPEVVKQNSKTKTEKKKTTKKLKSILKNRTEEKISNSKLIPSQVEEPFHSKLEVIIPSIIKG